MTVMKTPRKHIIETECCRKYSIDCVGTLKETKREALLHYEVSCN